jgi:hypothetical protein
VATQPVVWVFSGRTGVAIKVAEISLDDEFDSDSLGLYEKFVRAFGSHMSLAASSKARAASSAFSNVPSHTLVFLDITNMYTHEFIQYKNLKNSHPQDV